MKQKENKIKPNLDQITKMINASLDSFNLMHNAGFDDFPVAIRGENGHRGTINIVCMLQEITHALIKERAELENQKTK